jgi:putative Mg2+ transporter-C (MgtC) family protein
LDFDLIIAQFRDLDWTPFALAIVVGGTIGLEREVHGRPAGIRTHVMVCLSAAIAIQASQALATGISEPSAMSFVYDPSRLAAGIVTGIGFLGAATVIRSGDIVRGITTGACVWAVAVLGIAIGQEHYALALAGAGAMLAVLIGFDWIFRWVKPVVYRRLVITGKGSNLPEVSNEVSELLKREGIRIQDLAGRIDLSAECFEIEVFVRGRNQLQAPALLARVSALDGVQQVQWDQIGT